MKIERDEAPDPDVKHIAGEATGTRAERDTVGTNENGRREIIEDLITANFVSDLSSAMAAGIGAEFTTKRGELCAM